MSRIVFLDIDGVLNSRTYFDLRDAGRLRGDPAFGPHPIDRAAVAHLQRIVDATGAEIVVSSVWRYGTTTGKLRMMLAEHGLRGRVIGKTPEMDDGPRGLEIGRWLLDAEPVDSFVILDDNDDMAHLAHRLVQTDSKYGLREEEAQAAIAMLLESDA